MSDIKDFNKLKLNTNFLKDIKVINPIIDVVSKIQGEQQAAMDAFYEIKNAKEQEELRRHEELVSALKSAAENGATIVVGDNANGIQIQQNSQNATQAMTNVQSFNYDQARDVLNEIKEYFDFPQFAITFQDKTDMVKQIVNETIEAIQRKDEPTLIKKSLKVLKDLTIGIGGSLIATGISGLLSSIPL